MFYSRKRTQELRNKDNKEVKTPNKEHLKQAGVEWGQMSAKQKQPFVDMAIEDKARYARELEAYQNSQAQPPKKKGSKDE